MVRTAPADSEMAWHGTGLFRKVVAEVVLVGLLVWRSASCGVVGDPFVSVRCVS